ncbi:MAG: four helix bundle protein [Anaerolineae bacterium]|nr:four helix bundle protein [Anaerolineae bacterium]
MKNGQKFDIQERTFEFAVRVVKLINRLPRTTAGVVIGRQVVRSATSIGSNVEEADAAESKRDFIHKMSIAHEEARETRYWLRIIQASLISDDNVQTLIQESDELVRILYSIVNTARKSPNGKTGR